MTSKKVDSEESEPESESEISEVDLDSPNKNVFII